MLASTRTARVPKLGRGVLMPEAVIELDDDESAAVREHSRHSATLCRANVRRPVAGRAYVRGKARLFIKDDGEIVISSQAHRLWITRG